MFNCASVGVVSTCALVGVVALGSICVSVGVLTFIHLLAFCIDAEQLSSFCLQVQRILILGASCYLVVWCQETSDVMTGFGEIAPACWSLSSTCESFGPCLRLQLQLQRCPCAVRGSDGLATVQFLSLHGILIAHPISPQ